MGIFGIRRIGLRIRRTVALLRFWANFGDSCVDVFTDILGPSPERHFPLLIGEYLRHGRALLLCARPGFE